MNKFKVIYTLKNERKKEFEFDSKYREVMEKMQEINGCHGIDCGDCPFEALSIKCIAVEEIESIQIIDQPQFQVGDIVDWCGAMGEVMSENSGRDYENITVAFGDYVKVFLKDGRYFDWHKEPSLKLVERAKTKEPICETCVKNDVCEKYKNKNITIEACMYFLKK